MRAGHDLPPGLQGRARLPTQSPSGRHPSPSRQRRWVLASHPAPSALWLVLTEWTQQWDRGWGDWWFPILCPPTASASPQGPLWFQLLAAGLSTEKRGPAGEQVWLAAPLPSRVSCPPVCLFARPTGFPVTLSMCTHTPHRHLLCSHHNSNGRAQPLHGALLCFGCKCLLIL